MHSLWNRQERLDFLTISEARTFKLYICRQCMYIVCNMSPSCLEKATLRRRKYKLYQLLMTNYLELSLLVLSINFPLKCSSLPACLSQQGKWMSRSISVIVVKEPDKLLYLMLKSSTPPMIVNERIYHCRMVSSFYWLYCPHSIRFVSHLRAAGRWFSPSTVVSSTNTTDRHDIT